MRVVLLAVAAALLSIGGCYHHNLASNGCHPSCSHAGHSGAPTYVAPLPHGYLDDRLGPHGPPTPTYAYPYYTVRAPRDFLLNDPPTIGR